MRWSGSARWKFQAGGVAPAPQLEAVRLMFGSKYCIKVYLGRGR